MTFRVISAIRDSDNFPSRNAHFPPFGGNPPPGICFPYNRNAEPPPPTSRISRHELPLCVGASLRSPLLLTAQLLQPALAALPAANFAAETKLLQFLGEMGAGCDFQCLWHELYQRKLWGFQALNNKRLLSASLFFLATTGLISGCEIPRTRVTPPLSPEEMDCWRLNIDTMQSLFADTTQEIDISDLHFDSPVIDRGTFHVDGTGLIEGHVIHFADGELIITFQDGKPFKAEQSWSKDHPLNVRMLLDCLGEPNQYSAKLAPFGDSPPALFVRLVWEHKGIFWADVVELSNAQREKLRADMIVSSVLGPTSQTHRIYWAPPGVLRFLDFRASYPAKEWDLLQDRYIEYRGFPDWQ